MIGSVKQITLWFGSIENHQAMGMQGDFQSVHLCLYRYISLVSIAVINPMTKNNLWRKGLFHLRVYSPSQRGGSA